MRETSNLLVSLASPRGRCKRAAQPVNGTPRRAAELDRMQNGSSPLDDDESRPQAGREGHDASQLGSEAGWNHGGPRP